MPHSVFTRNNNTEYFLILRGVLCLLVTAIVPIKKSYHASSIIPFAISEDCIKTLGMALMMPISANFFYDYLENYCDD